MPRQTKLPLKFGKEADMYLATVIGTVVSTSKDERLVGFKLLLTQQLNPDGTPAEEPVKISVDTVGA
ncbi:EutN/CcmL family microcompartment protein, partial [Stomatohabitans albus]|uniref:EutN/CcmL family microcompartment protein n=1 Tax=Stomatohabitans albus TaxID=3110766 RepID=UPI00300D2581